MRAMRKPRRRTRSRSSQRSRTTPDNRAVRSTVWSADVDNAGMPHHTDWHPVVPSGAVQAGASIVAARILGQELAVWRSAAGLVQVWHDRCPHRGVQLSLGRVKHDRLACAYHGWEFAADGGQCMVIPALADLPAPPGKVCAKTFSAIDAQGMVWVRLQSVQGYRSGDLKDAPARRAAPGTFLRSLALNVSESQLAATLRGYGMLPSGANLWTGSLDRRPVRVFVTCAHDTLALLHVWLEHAAPAKPLAPLFAALRRLRSDAEAAPA